MDQPRSRRVTAPQVIFWGSFAVALLLRLIHLRAFSDPVINPMFALPVTDAAVHHRWAQQILQGTWPGPEPFFRAPLYPYFLATLYRFFGAENPLSVLTVQTIISAFGAGFAGLCARRLWDHRAAWCAGLLFAGLATSIYFASELLAVTLNVTLNLLLLWLLLGSLTRKRCLLIGVTLGLSAITRPTVLVVTPVILWYLWQRCNSPAKIPVAQWAGLVLGLMLTILPVTVRNIVQGGEPVLIAASGGVNFYIGNNPHADGRVAFLPGAPPTWQGEMSDVTALAATELGRPTNALAADRYFWRKGLRFWRTQPIAAARLLARKTWLLLAAGERSNNKNLAFWYARSPLLRLPFWPGWALILGLAILGFNRQDMRRPERFLLVGLTATYGAALLLFFLNARFRLPVMAWLTVPAGGGLVILWDHLRQARRAIVPRKSWALAAVLTATSIVPDTLTYHQNPATDFESWRSLGNSYYAQKYAEQAIGAWQTALAIEETSPQSAHRLTLPLIYQPLAQLYRQRHRLGQALAVQRQWRAKFPKSVAARMGLADLYMQAGRADSASVLLSAILSQDPDNHQARMGYAWALYRTKHESRALPEFERAASHLTDPYAAYGAALCQLSLGNPEGAIVTLREVVRKNARFWQAWESLAQTYQQLGDAAEERRCWQQLLRLNPQHQTARRRLNR